MATSTTNPKPQPVERPGAGGPDLRAAKLVSHLSLADGLRLCLSLVDEGSPSFGVAALRWHSCFCGRALEISLPEAEGALAALGRLRGVGWRAAGEELRELSLRYQQDEAVEILDWWLRRSGRPSP